MDCRTGEISQDIRSSARRIFDGAAVAVDRRSNEADGRIGKEVWLNIMRSAQYYDPDLPWGSFAAGTVEPPEESFAAGTVGVPGESVDPSGMRPSVSYVGPEIRYTRVYA